MNIKNINYKEWRKFPKWLWRKIKALVVGIQQKYREKFPKKQPKLYDADIHEMKYILKLAILAFFMYLYIETFARATDGIFNGVMMIWKQPLIFVYNWLIIFATLTISFCSVSADSQP